MYTLGVPVDRATLRGAGLDFEQCPNEESSAWGAHGGKRPGTLLSSGHHPPYSKADLPGTAMPT